MLEVVGRGLSRGQPDPGGRLDPHRVKDLAVDVDQPERDADSGHHAQRDDQLIGARVEADQSVEPLLDAEPHARRARLPRDRAHASGFSPKYVAMGLPLKFSISEYPADS